ncbi:MAG: phage holin, LLH family [Gemmataceae bacterium]
MTYTDNTAAVFTQLESDSSPDVGNALALQRHLSDVVEEYEIKAAQVDQALANIESTSTKLKSAATITAAEQTGGFGSDKFNTAKASVMATLEAQGIALVMNAVHGAIEAAVAQQKSNSRSRSTACRPRFSARSMPSSAILSYQRAIDIRVGLSVLPVDD